MKHTGSKKLRQALGFCFSLIWLIALLHLPSVSAVQRTFPTADDFALEIPDIHKQPTYHEIHSTSPSTMTFYHFERIKDWQPTKTPFTKPTAIQLKCYREGNVVKIEAAVLLGPFDQQDTPHSFAGVPKESLGSYSVRLNESVSLEKMTQWGLVPMTIKVVTAKSSKPNPARIENKTTAIEMVGVDEARDLYLLKLRNRSAKPIIALKVYVPSGRDRTSQLMRATAERPLIAPGQIYSVRVAIGRGGWNTPEGYVPDQPTPPRIVIAGVIFADSTFEGETEMAIYVAASKRGEKIQKRRLLDLLQAAQEAQEPDRHKAIERLREQVAALSEEPDERVVIEMVKAFAPVTESQREELRVGLQTGLNDARQSLLFALNDYERGESSSGESANRTSFQQWLSLMKTQYEK
jgi:hypothetical protein